MLLNNVVFSHSKREAHQWLPALIGAIGSLAGGAISAISQHHQNKQNIQSSKDLMDYQWTNYGSPSAQLAAYHAAGLNPNASSQLLQQPQSQVPDQAAPGSQFASSMQSFIAPFAQLLAISSQIKQVESQTDLINAQKEGTFIDNDLKKFDLGSIKPEELKKLQAEIESTKTGERLTRQQIRNASFELLKLQAEKKGLDLDNLMKEMDNEWKKRQLDRRMPELQVEFQELSNERIRQQKNISSADEEVAVVRKEFLSSLHDIFDKINSTEFNGDNFFGIPLNSDTKPFIRAFVNMLLYKLLSVF